MHAESYECMAVLMNMFPYNAREARALAYW